MRVESLHCLLILIRRMVSIDATGGRSRVSAFFLLAG